MAYPMQDYLKPFKKARTAIALVRMLEVAVVENHSSKTHEFCNTPENRDQCCICGWPRGGARAEGWQVNVRDFFIALKGELQVYPQLFNNLDDAVRRIHEEV